MTPTEHRDRFERARSIDLMSVVAPHIQMHKRGGYWRGLCPFHVEKTPSFTIRDGSDVFKCYGCGQWGNVIDFVVKLKGCSRAEAVSALLADCLLESPKRAVKRVLNGKPTEYAELPWRALVNGVFPQRSRELAAWRGYDPDFVRFLLSECLFATYQGAFCFPIHDAKGRVVRLHVRPREINAKNWFYYPATGHPTTPLVFGDGPRARLHESQWDALADMNNEWRKGTMDQSTWIITRGASNAHKLPPNTFKRAYIFAQNDAAGMKWARDCAAKYAGAKIVVPPSGIKDVNDLWKSDKSLKRLAIHAS